ncbi:MAG: hypothetical protein ABSF92_00340 [Candidatus Acidiferrales bacterium]|jgi:hypothetical protein
MAENVTSKQARVLVIGTQHELQRHQDTAEDRKKVRVEFEGLLRRLIGERSITLVAEEAGDDRAVWELLKREEDSLGEYVEAFGGGRTVDAPVSTIAKNIANGHSDQLRHADIRVNADEMPLVEQRDEAMAAKIMEILGDAESVLVVVGEDHREGVVQRLRKQGLLVGSLRFP